jgi:hypothetical protein
MEPDVPRKTTSKSTAADCSRASKRAGSRESGDPPRTVGSLLEAIENQYAAADALDRPTTAAVVV